MIRGFLNIVKKDFVGGTLSTYRYFENLAIGKSVSPIFKVSLEIQPLSNPALIVHSTKKFCSNKLFVRSSDF